MYIVTILLEVCASMVSNCVCMCIGSLVPRPQIYCTFDSELDKHTHEHEYVYA